MNPNIFGRAVTVVFGAIGVTVIYALWTAEGMDEPPLFFKIFGSLIASLFVLIGIGGILGKGMKPAAGDPDGTSATSGATNLQCRSCGAPVAEGAEVSPSGDVKCPYCKAWFNVRQDA